MKGLVLYERGKTEIREVQKPECGDRDILIKVESAAICGGDVHFYNGALPCLGEYPIILGHEFAGTIAKMGPHADTYWKVGDRVISENTASVCGRCPACEKGNFVNCPERETLGCSVDGAFTQYVKIPGDLLAVYPNCLFRLPEEIPMETAPLLEPAANAYMAVVQEGQMMPGENVVVFGAGALGLFSVQMAKIAGAAKIILIGMPSDEESRFPCGRKLGATHTIINGEGVDLAAEVEKICGMSGVALCIDAAGAPAVLKQAVEIVRNDGIVVRIGMNDKPYGYGMNEVNVKSVSITGHMGYNTTSWRNVISLAAAGKLDLASLVSHRLPLSQIKHGFELLKDQTAIKIVIDPDN
ncbi:zinc-dependent alcohol dehydrogenase [[Clostridium] hylemonae]|uniref:Chlorophyll synthesis pathway protein BchC n=1 Tax=[Clostridium] hylemonae DSM 15053 TaxID=553973 RepID=C0C6H5_9FIRM|nr:alcohol dehydrogenase catalytic domain-containing protein [[Clostridium] hylemonae]EEG72310.1 putative chlorophyll synthesis pathway protein BchC [[Clostridium] hylemonae DSM 15053]QEK16859.1 D-arabitol-phosphate dehydrogenase [[Clostridium] hylemonae DSM 15053]